MFVCERLRPADHGLLAQDVMSLSLPTAVNKRWFGLSRACSWNTHPAPVIVRDEWITLNVSHWVSRAESNRAVFVEVAEHCVSWLKLWRALGGTAVCATSGTEQPSLGTENNQLFSPWVICRAAAHMTDSCTLPWADPVNILKWLCPEFKCDFFF